MVHSLKLYVCGDCSRKFAVEEELRAHIAVVGEDGDSHDGEPWHELRVDLGSRLYYGDKPVFMKHLKYLSTGDVEFGIDGVDTGFSSHLLSQGLHRLNDRPTYTEDLE